MLAADSEIINMNIVRRATANGHPVLVERKFAKEGALQ
jgi:hypothetical protein